MRRLHEHLPEIPVEFFDERYTSVLAHQAMLQGGLRKKARQNKALVDEISATIILQGWMESRMMLKKIIYKIIWYYQFILLVSPY